MNEVIIPYSPWDHQLAYHNDTARFRVLVDHRRSGKTTAVVNDVLKDVMTAPPKSVGAYIAPLRNQAKRVAWPLIQEFGQPFEASFDQADLVAKLPGKRRVYVMGSDNPDAIRGMGLVAAAIDETAQTDPTAWRLVIRPALSDTEGSRATFIGTPKGRLNLLHDLYSKAVGKEDWSRRVLTVADTGGLCITKQEQSSLRRDMTPEEYDQEYMCSFNAAIVGNYYGKELAKAEAEGRITTVIYDRTLQTFVALDLGMADLMTAWIVQAAGNQCRLLKSMSWRRTALPDVMQDIKELGWPIKTVIAPHDVKVQEMGTGATRLETLQRGGADVLVCPDIGLANGIEAVTNFLPRCVFDRKGCEEGLEGLHHYKSEFDEKTRVTSLRPVHDWASHYADGFRYLAVGLEQAMRSARMRDKPRLPYTRQAV